MAYIEHGTLREKLAHGPLSLKDAGIILEQLASALQFAHDQGILHRDIKPSNILLKDDTHIYLADFGLAKEIEDCTTITQTNCLIGTPDYMAPELMEEAASIRSDIYALGVMLYHMLTGRVPFKASTPIAVYWKHIKEQPPFPADINPDITPEVEEVILHAMEKNPEDRFESVQEMAQAYKRALIGSDKGIAEHIPVPQTLRDVLPLEPVVQRIIPIGQMELKTRRLHPAFITMVAAFFLLVLPLSFGISVYGNGVQFQTALGANVSAPVLGTHEVVAELPEKLRNVTPGGTAGVQVAHPYSIILTRTSNTIRKSHPVQSGQGGHKHRHKHDHIIINMAASPLA